MNKRMRSIIVMLSLAVLLVGMSFISTEASAANEFYGDYTDVSKVYDYGSCPSMQGMAVGSQKMYTIKIGSNDSLAFISMTDKDTGSTTKLYNADAGSYYFNYMGHANDMDVWGIDGYSNLFVATTNEGSNAIVRLKRSGNNLTKVASYSLTYNGEPTCATALAVKSVSGGKITFITKLGMNLYTGSVSTSATSANIELTKLCTISKSRVYIKGEYLNLSNFVNQGFGYYNDTLFVPITGDDTQLNRSVILVFDLRNASGTIYPTEALVFRVTSSYYSALFEIESCDICSGDGKLYFNTNRRRTNSDTNHDGVSYMDSYTFSSLPTDAPTSAPKFTLRYNANGGTGTMADTVVTYGQATPISTNAFTRTGYTFTGYTAYRQTQGQWRYQSGWYAEGSQPSGETKYQYRGGEKVSATTSVNGDVVQLYAQWTKNNYTVKFVDADGTVLKTQTLAHGKTPTAPANPTKASDSQYSYTFAGWSPAITAATANTTYTATYTATPLDTSAVTGKIEGSLERVTAVSQLEEGVPYIISDYKTSWLQYVLTNTPAQKTASGRTHEGFLLDGTASVSTTDLWYIKDGYLVYGSPDSNQYLLISYDSSRQGHVTLGSFDAATAAYVTSGTGDDLVIRSTSYYLNRHGGTANDFVATAYTSVGGSYWHFDRLHKDQTVKLSAKAAQSSVSAGSKTSVVPTVTIDGVSTNNYTLSFSSSNTSIATVNASGVVTAVKAGTVTITAKLTAAGGSDLASAISVKVKLTVKDNSVSATGTQSATLVNVGSLQTGVPYVITEKSTGATLTGNMLYTTSAGYKGLNGLQGLQTVDSFDINNAPVWYYDGSRLLYGTSVGSNNYLIYNSSNQVTLGSASSANVFDKITVYSSSNKTFNISSSNLAASTNSIYINQYGGSNYNVVNLYSNAYYSQWYFRQLQPQRTATLTAAPGSVSLAAGKSVTVDTAVTVDGASTGNYSITYSSSNESVAVVNSSGVITAVGSGNAVITAKLTSADGRTVDVPATVQIAVQVTGNNGITVSAVQEAQLIKTASLETGVPYVITENVTGVVLTGEMLYTTSAGYNGLSGSQGLKLDTTLNLSNAPVWYYDGTHLLYGTSVGSNNYLVYNSSNQVALGSISTANIFDTVTLYSASNQTFTIHGSGKSSGSTNYYLNQYGGSGYNVAALWHYAGSSLWQFSRYIPEKTVSMSIDSDSLQLTKGSTAVLSPVVTVNGTTVSNCVLTWKTSDASVATVANGTITAVKAGTVTVTLTLSGAEGDTFAKPLTIQIPVTVQ